MPTVGASGFSTASAPRRWRSPAPLWGDVSFDSVAPRCAATAWWPRCARRPSACRSKPARPRRSPTANGCCRTTASSTAPCCRPARPPNQSATARYSRPPSSRAAWTHWARPSPRSAPPTRMPGLMSWPPTVLGSSPPSGGTRCPSCAATTVWCWPASRTTTTPTGRTCRTVTSSKSPQSGVALTPLDPTERTLMTLSLSNHLGRRLGVSRIAPRCIRRPAEDAEVVAAQVVLRFGGQRPVRPDHPAAGVLPDACRGGDPAGPIGRDRHRPARPTPWSNWAAGPRRRPGCCSMRCATADRCADSCRSTSTPACCRRPRPPSSASTRASRSKLSAAISRSTWPRFPTAVGGCSSSWGPRSAT